MLAIVESYLRALSSARSETELARVLAEAAKSFGFRSAYIVEYAGKLSEVQRVIDTDAKRKSWWNEYFASDLRPTPRDVEAMLASATLLRLSSARLSSEPTRLRAALEMHDVVDVVAVPISHQAELVGVVGFCGAPVLDRQQETALQIVGYTAFSWLHGRANHEPSTKASIALTPRETEVMRLSAEGRTSAEIAQLLGMSTRTANQHIDNVSDKLGTRNRAHTVAEIVRRGLI